MKELLERVKFQIEREKFDIRKRLYDHGIDCVVEDRDGEIVLVVRPNAKNLSIAELSPFKHRFSNSLEDLEFKLEFGNCKRQ